MDFIDFSECKFSNRHGRYGGNAGDKDGIIYNDEFWIIKYPKTTRSMQGNHLPKYTTSPLSEYIGSHIYEILGFDVFIGNNDRNNGNWGVLYEDDGIKLAPVFDNGNSFANKTDEEGIYDFFKLPIEEKINRLVGERTAYSYNDKIISAKKMISWNDDNLQLAIVKIVPLIIENLDNITQMIDSIPDKVGELDICSNARKQFYKECLQIKLDALLSPAYLSAKDRFIR